MMTRDDAMRKIREHLAIADAMEESERLREYGTEGVRLLRARLAELETAEIR